MFWSHTIALHEEQTETEFIIHCNEITVSVRTWEADQSNSNEWQNYLIHSKRSTQKNDSFMNQASLLLSNYCITSEDFSAWVIWTTFMTLSWCFSVRFVLSLFIVISLAREKYSIFFPCSMEVNDDNFPLSTFLISWVIMKHSQFNKHQKTSYDTDMYLQTADESMHWHDEAMPCWRKFREERKWQRRKRNMFRLYCRKQRPIHQPTVTEGRLRHVSTPPIPERQFRLSLNALNILLTLQNGILS